MNEEEKKAIKELTEIKELVEEDLKYDDYEVTATLDQIDLKSLVIALNLIEKQQRELDKKDKIIAMAMEVISRKTGSRIEICKNMNCDKTIEKECKKCALEYFTKKVDE